MEGFRALLFVGLGGAAGSICRYLAQLGLGRVTDGKMPWGTLAVNILGSMLLVLILTSVEVSTPHGERIRLTLGVGLLGGFTTYSTFNAELIQLVRSGETAMAFGYFAATVLGSLAAGCLVLWLSR